MNADGTIDTAWGKNGVAAVPAVPAQLAWDSANHLLYSGSNGVMSGVNDGIARVTRLRADGSLDATFADGGVFTYTTPYDGSETTFATATVEAVNPLKDGSAIVALQRRRSDSGSSVVDTDLTLYKLRRGGTRGPN